MNGDLIYPKKGKQPPDPIEGYMADEKDSWVHHRIYKSCKYRSFVNTPTPCGVKRYTYFCALDNFITQWNKCNTCSRAVMGESQQLNETNDVSIRCEDGSYL